MRVFSSYRQLGLLLTVAVTLLVLLGWWVIGNRPVASESGGVSPAAKTASDTRLATFAGGCFWCMEPPFEKLDGVGDVVSGYTGGDVANPAYEQVASGGTGHLEAVQVPYDPSRVSYRKLLDVYWRQINPTDAGGQFVDRGEQYTSRIFYHSERQRKLAEQSRRILEESGIYDKPIVTGIVPAGEFYRAEDYHQDYYKTHSLQYKFYRYRSGRDDYLEQTWKGHEDFEIFDDADRVESNPRPGSSDGPYTRPGDGRIREMLTPLQYRVTQEDGTEPPYENKYWDNKEPGIYVDVVSGEPLFSSRHKYESGTGWPSFYKPLVEENIVTRPDHSWFGTRTEVRSKHGDSHLGHVFEDGPEPTGLRYCLNSAALEFIPVDRLEQRGYGSFLDHFKSTSK